MIDTHEDRAQDHVEYSLKQVLDIIGRQRLVESLVHKQEMPNHELVENLVHKQNLNELSRKLEDLHPADVAYILEALPPEDRLMVWDLVKAERDGEILLEVSDAVRESLIATMDNRELVAAAATLDTDEIADLAADLPKDVVQELMESLDVAKRAQVEASLAYDDDSVGAMMDYDFVTIRADVTLETALRYLRRLGELPSHTDKLFVIDRDERLIGTLPLKRMLVHDPEAHVAAVMSDDPVVFHPSDSASDAAQARERAGLSACSSRSRSARSVPIERTTPTGFHGPCPGSFAVARTPSSEIWMRSRPAATCSGDPSPSSTPVSTSLAAVAERRPPATRACSSARWAPVSGLSSAARPRRRRWAVTSPVSQLAATRRSAPAAPAASRRAA